MEENEISTKKTNKRGIPSTIVMGVFLFLCSFYAVFLAFYNLKEVTSVFVYHTEGGSSSPFIYVLAEMLEIFSGFGLVMVNFLAYMPAIIVLVISSICLPFSIKNRRSSYPAIVVINYIYDGIFASFIVMAIVKIILFATGIA